MRDLLSLPKAHLHVHLESTIRWSTLREIGAANGVRVPGDVGSFGDFASFFAQNDLVRACLRRPGDFRRIAYEFCEDEAAQGVRYAEVSFTAAGHGERLGDLAMPLQGVLEGLEAGQEAFGIECRLILDHSRRRSVERAWTTLELARRHDRVVAVGLAGDEAHPAATARAFGISRVSSGSVRPSTDPATLNVRRTTAPAAPVRACQRTACSAASFDAPYGLAGAGASLSGIGCRSGAPYTAAVEPSTIRSAATASSRFTVPWTLAAK